MVYNNNPAGPRATPSPQIPTARPRAGSRPTSANVNLPPVEKAGAADFSCFFVAPTHPLTPRLVFLFFYSGVASPLIAPPRNTQLGRFG